MAATVTVCTPDWSCRPNDNKHASNAASLAVVDDQPGLHALLTFASESESEIAGTARAASCVATALLLPIKASSNMVLL